MHLTLRHGDLRLQGQLDDAKRVGRQEARDRENAVVECEMAR